MIPPAPRFRLPATRERYWLGGVIAVVVHVAALVLLLLPPRFDADDYRRGIGSPALVAGGGGGGDGRVREMHFLHLASPAPPRDESRGQPLPEPPVEPPPEVVPQPEQEEFTVALPEAVAQASDAKATGLLTGGDGSGRGPGSGGGVGSGRGVGVGSGTGPGTGGEGGDVLVPTPRASPFPFARAPAAIDGVELTVRFFVDERGRVVRVTIEPEIADRGYRRRVLETFESWTFYPARTLGGRPVKGVFVAHFTP